jgi:hypothetical protein
VFVDAQAQARADVDIQDSVLPEFVPSHTVTVPTIYGPEIYINPVFAGNYPDWALNPPPVGNVQPNPERYSSFIPTIGASLATFQLTMDHYTGNIKAQAAETYQSTWYDVSNINVYLNKTGSEYINVLGYHPLLRLALNSYSGAEIVGLFREAAIQRIKKGGKELKEEDIKEVVDVDGGKSLCLLPWYRL